MTQLNSIEIATILAALRLRQADLSGVAGEPIRADAGDLDNIATNDGEFDALGIKDIDALCERLNAVNPVGEAVILKGNPVDGFSAVGPFPSREAAVEAGGSIDSDWWVLDLEAPEE